MHDRSIRRCRRPGTMGWPPSAPRPRRSPRSRPSCTARAGTRSCSPRSGERMRSPHSGSSALLTRACITRSLTVGIPKGRVLPFAFGMYTRLAGLGLYRPRDRSVSRSAWRCFGVLHTTPSTPGVLRPRFCWVTWRIASSFADRERTSSFWRFFTFPKSPSFAARKIRSCSRRTASAATAQSMPDHGGRGCPMVCSVCTV